MTEKGRMVPNSYSAAWAEYRRRNSLAIASIVSFVVLPFVAWKLTKPGYWTDLIIGTVEVAILFSIVICGMRVATWPCPRCRKIFRGFQRIAAIVAFRYGRKTALENCEMAAICKKR
jgi:hypothetical protein